MWKFTKKLMLSLAMVAVVGCSGDAGFSTSGSADDTTSVTVASIVLLASSPQLGSSGTTPVTITAIVKDSGNLVTEDIPVVFSADSGSLQPENPAVTDAAGMVTATLTPGGDYTNRTISVSALAGSISQTTTVDVAGTSISISGENTVTLGDTTQLTMVLTDSDGDPIGGKVITITSDDGNDLSSTSIATDANGQVQITVEADIAGTDTIRAAAQGVTTTHTLTISSDQFQITTPAADADINLGAVQDVTARWRISGTPQVGATINFSSTRGTLSANSAITNASGDATVTISSTNAGPATITTYVTNGPSTSKTVEFVATTADSIELQANPVTIGPNDGSQAITQQSTITATVRDANNNLVKGKVIRFSVTDFSGGALTASVATTNSLGKATTTYVSSAATTALDDVIVSAVVQDAPAVTTTVSLTVARSELFVVLGTGNKILAPTDTQYNKEYVVLVTDATGNAVEGAEVSIAINPVAYYKGFRFWDDPNTIWAQTITAGPCFNEDVDEDGILDAGEDVNGNGRIDPANVISAPSTVTTGADGSYEFDLIYAKDFADWVNVKLTASDEVSGTEATHTVTFDLPAASGDLTSETVAPPGVVSPFGTGVLCSDPN